MPVCPLPLYEVCGRRRSVQWGFEGCRDENPGGNAGPVKASYLPSVKVFRLDKV